VIHNGESTCEFDSGMRSNTRTRRKRDVNILKGTRGWTLRRQQSFSRNIQSTAP
jgi:hypothetical protein